MQAERYIAAVDLGTSKIALSVAKVTGDDIQLLYYKETASDGIRYSGVFNPKRAAAPLLAAVKEAEAELSIKILQVVVGLPRYSVRQEIASAKMQRSDPATCISKEEIDTLKEIAIDSYTIDDESKEEIYGAVAQSFSADDELVCANENDVVGTTADSLEGNFKIFIGELKPVSNVDMMLNDAGIAPAQKVFLPNAVAQAVLTDSEKENGVALVEMGAGVTSVTVYRGKLLRHFSSIPFGGSNITSDIKYECGFPFGLAENIKLAFGACLPDKLQSMSDKVLQINDDENGTYEHLPVKYLSEIITCRSNEIIDAILYQLQDSGYADQLRNGIVLTGGGANLVNLANQLRDKSGYSVRIGYPRNRVFSSGGCEGANETSAAASIGMIIEAKKDYLLNCIEEARPQAKAEETAVSEASGELFGGQELGEVITPSKSKEKRNENKKRGRITWTRKFTEKVGAQIGKAFDESLGELFDKTELKDNI